MIRECLFGLENMVDFDASSKFTSGILIASRKRNMPNVVEARAQLQTPAAAEPLTVPSAVPNVSPLPAKVLDLKPGELAEIRSVAEIVATLDVDGKLDGLPFMPEMQKYCGQRFRVSRRADSTCVGGQPRIMENTVHLATLRCDGSAHYECQAACSLLWKEAWLRRAFKDSHESVYPTALSAPASASNESAAPLMNGHVANGELLHNLPKPAAERPNQKLGCQATELNTASRPLSLGHPANYLARVALDYRSAKIGTAELRILWTYLRGKLILAAFTAWARAPWNAERYKKTPSERLDLRVGEWVQVRSAREVLATLDRNGCNRGMEFKAEMFQFCGRKFPVIARMNRRIDERTGMMREFRNECIMLLSVHCHGQRSFCARNNYHYWREIWLHRCSRADNAE